MTFFLRLPPVKALNFALAVVLGIRINVIPSKKNNGLAPLYIVYTFRDENLYRLNLQAIHTKSVKADNVEVDTDIWNDASAEVFRGGYIDKRHKPLFQQFRNIMAKRFKINVVRRFVCYMVESYSPSRSVCQGDIRKEGGRDM